PRVRGFLGRPGAAARRPTPARRRECTPAAAGDAFPPPARLALGTDERERDVEQPVEDGAIFLVLHQTGGEGLAQHLATDTSRRDGAYGVHRLGERDVDALG